MGWLASADNQNDGRDSVRTSGAKDGAAEGAMTDESGPAATVGALIAPVVACLRNDAEAVRVLLADVRERLPVADIVRAAPAVAGVYLRLAPPPDGADHIVTEFPDAALARFRAPELVELGVECLHVARVAEPVEGIARAAFVHDALDHGEHTALACAIATCWWCALESARMRDVDPVEEAAAICRYVARVA
jgi:hypothetical protein